MKLSKRTLEELRNIINGDNTAFSIGNKIQPR